ncbi:hypothetical protein Vretifemale_20532 [Volvox reticuliferus]|uniref:Serine aminopeptidase S33 domain-containing protein n=1 Tax=Volvox reticuliferus TaxID=1737510 RepID=A0A8J4D0T6_9CHLO|nr:hypothetical protein Vretifemale_20532 [Volvox reticuliferus]
MGSCLSRNEVHPKFDEEKDYLGQHGYSKLLKNEDGAALFAYLWPANPDVPLKGIIQLVHGNSAYTCFDYLKFKGAGLPNLYEGSWVEAFNRAGFSVCGLDHQGYGRSKGVRPGNKFQTHVDNLLLLADDVIESGSVAFPKEAPYFLIGHSMGGLAATLACLKRSDRFAGLVLLSPMLSLEPSAKRSGSLRLGLKSRPNSDDGESSTASEQPASWILEAWAADPFVHDGGQRSSRTAADLSSAAGQLAADGVMEGLVVPLLVFQSEKDTYADPEGARRLNERAASTDKTLRLLNQQWHVLMKEEGWEALLEETVAWLAARATNSGALTRGLDEVTDGQEGAGKAAGDQGGGDAEAAAPKAEAGGENVAGGGKESVENKGEKEGVDDGVAAAATAVAEPAAAEAALEPSPAEALEVERAERSSAPVLIRSMSMLGRMPEHEPLAPGGVDAPEASPPVPARRYSFGGRVTRPIAAPGDTTPTPSSGSMLGPLPPLAPLGQRRTLGALPPELASFNVRGRLPPLPPLMPLLDRKPIG